MFILDSTNIRRPMSIQETNDTQVAVKRALNGSIKRDYFGSNKRVWELQYTNVKVEDYETIKAIYDSYLSTGNLKTWQITEGNYPVAETNVHIDLKSRSFSVGGTHYLSDFTLTLTEA